MKVLFVSSGNSMEGISPIIKNQGQSLIDSGIEVHFFTIKGKGFWSYFRHIFILKKFLGINHFDVVHSHYSLTSFVASLSGAKPLVVSLMGSDVLARRYPGVIISFFHKKFWSRTIVKSKDMKKNLGLENIEIIPNGVDTAKFYPMGKSSCIQKTKWDKEKINILFAASPDKAEKNISLIHRAIDLIKDEYHIVLYYMKDIPHEEIPFYINAADIISLTSLHEGSPNAIKEAMACNCPVVSTDVGDIKWIFGDTEGCYLTSFDAVAVADELRKAIEFTRIKGRTNGRQRIVDLGLDSVTVARKIINLYINVLDHQS